MAGSKKHKQIKVIAGSLKGRPLSYPEERALRPTMQRTKAAVFDSLGGGLEGAVFVDLYAAAGGMGIEALSRGARCAHFVESDRRALACLRANLERCRVTPDRYRIHPRDVLDCLGDGSLPRDESTILFADPPYDSKELPLLLEFFDGIGYAFEALLIVEHPRDAVPLDRLTRLVRTKLKKFGQSQVSYFESAEEGEKS